MSVKCGIVGLPNVGKSTLFNTLLGRQRAIVSAEPGTTRDVVEASRAVMRAAREAGVPRVVLAGSVRSIARPARPLEP